MILRGYLSSRRTKGAPTLSGKAGGMLILVIVVLAVGVILITSAVSVTIATREHFFENAQSSQARLTATASAQAIAEAVTVTQEINDYELKAWADRSGGVGPGSGSVLFLREGQSTDQNADPSTGTLVPGVGSSGAAAYTQVNIYYTDSSRDKIAIDVTTHLNALGVPTGASERVVVTLEEIPPQGAVEGFGGMITAGGGDSANVFNNTQIGQGASASASSNYIVLHGNYSVGQGTVNIASDIVYTGLVSASAGLSFPGNIIFYGDQAGVTAFGGDGVKAGGVLLFIGEDANQASVLRDSSGNARVNYTGGYAGGFHGEEGAYFYRTRFSGNTQGMWGGGNIFLDGGTESTFHDSTSYKHGAYDNDQAVLISGTWTQTHAGNTPTNDTSSFVGAVRTAALKYTDPDFTVIPERNVLTTSEAIEMVNYSDAAAAQAQNLDEFLNDDVVFDGSAYRVTAGGTLNGRWTFDLANGDIVLYVIGNGTLNIAGNAKIHFVNGGPSWGRIILTQGAHINIARTDNLGDGRHGGILATERTAETEKRAGQENDGKPYLYIIGLGGNHLDVGRYANVEGYIGLYGNPYVDGSETDTPGRFRAHNGPYIYGRVEAVTVENFNPGDPMRFPYCPAPTDADSSDGREPLQSSYQVESYQYLPVS